MDGGPAGLWLWGWAVVTPATSCHLCRSVFAETITDHLSAHHQNEILDMEIDPEAGTAVIHGYAPVTQPGYPLISIDAFPEGFPTIDHATRMSLVARPSRRRSWWHRGWKR